MGAAAVPLIIASSLFASGAAVHSATGGQGIKVLNQKPKAPAMPDLASLTSSVEQTERTNEQDAARKRARRQQAAAARVNEPRATILTGGLGAAPTATKTLLGS